MKRHLPRTESLPQPRRTPARPGPRRFWLGALILALAVPLLRAHIDPTKPNGNPKASGGAASDNGASATGDGSAGSQGAGGSGGGGSGGGAAGGPTRGLRPGQARAPGVTGAGLAGVAAGETCPTTPPDDNNNPDGDDPVALSTGSTFFSAVDIPRIPGNGQSGNATLGFNRFYSSRQAAAANDGPLGIGWYHNYLVRLEPNWDGAGGVKITRWDSREIGFTSPDGGSTFTAPAGEASTLTRSGGYYYWKLLHGTQYKFNASTYLLTSLLDRRNNAVTFGYSDSKLTTASDGARTVTFTFTGTHITQATDGTRTVSYSYSGDHLQSVSDSLGTRVTYYYDDITYNPDAITRVVDGRGNTRRFGYDVTGAVFAETNALNSVQSYTWDWANWNVIVTNYSGKFGYAVGFDSGGRQTTYTNALGRIQYNLDPATGLLTNYVDMMGYGTTNLWNATQLLLAAQRGSPGFGQLVVLQRGLPLRNPLYERLGRRSLPVRLRCLREPDQLRRQVRLHQPVPLRQLREPDQRYRPQPA